MNFQDTLREVSKQCNIVVSSLQASVGEEKTYINNIFKYFIQRNINELNENFTNLFKCNLNENSYYLVYQLYNLIYAFITNDGRTPFCEYNKSDVEEYIKWSQNKPTDPLNKITVTMTTCKRFDLFRRTMISILKYVKDLKQYLFDWIVIDDNSSEKMRNQMKEEFPFITYIYKDETNKGHARSLNILMDMIKTPYVMNIEDDWEFFFPDNYVTKLLNILKEDKSYGQALINVNYSEDLTTYSTVKGSTMKRTNDGQRYFVHNFYQGRQLEDEVKKLGTGNCYYWPHYSLRVGLTHTRIFKELGKYNEKAKHFEMEYAHIYYAKGYRTIFLDNVSCLHIGRRTYERQTDMINAYDLNEEKQFGEDIKKVKDENVFSKSIKQETKEQVATNNIATNNIAKNNIELKMFVVNLNRRFDRLQSFYKDNYDELLSFEVLDAFDGKFETPTHKIMKLFKSSDYDYRCGLVGCVVSHVKIWKQFLEDVHCNYAIVLEDDIVVQKDFCDKVIYLINKYKDQFEVMFLHQNPYGQYNKTNFHSKHKIPEAYSMDGVRALKENMGSTACYIISRKGAENGLRHLSENGGYNGIDWIMMKTASENHRVMYSVPFLVEAPCWNMQQSADTDIQREFGKIKWSDEEWDTYEIKYLEQLLSKSIYNVHDKNNQVSLVLKTKNDYINKCSIDILKGAGGRLHMIYTQTIPWNNIIDDVFILPLKSVTSEDKKKLNKYAVKWYYTNQLFYILPDKYVTKGVLEDKVFRDEYLNLVKPI